VHREGIASSDSLFATRNFSRRSTSSYFLIGLEAERIKAFASLPLGYFLLSFAQFAILSRTPLIGLTRTVWRGRPPSG